MFDDDLIDAAFDARAVVIVQERRNKNVSVAANLFKTEIERDRCARLMDRFEIDRIIRTTDFGGKGALGRDDLEFCA